MIQGNSSSPEIFLTGEMFTIDELVIPGVVPFLFGHDAYLTGDSGYRIFFGVGQTARIRGWLCDIIIGPGSKIIRRWVVG